MEDMGVKGYGTMSKGQSNQYSILAFYFFPFTFTLLTNLWRRKYLNPPNEPNFQKRITENCANEPNPTEPSVKTLNDVIRENRRNPRFKKTQNKPNFKNQQNALTPFPIAGCWKLEAGR
jgi:hypothetical protein